MDSEEWTIVDDSLHMQSAPVEKPEQRSSISPLTKSTPQQLSPLEILDAHRTQMVAKLADMFENGPVWPASLGELPKVCRDAYETHFSSLQEQLVGMSKVATENSVTAFNWTKSEAQRLFFPISDVDCPVDSVGSSEEDSTPLKSPTSISNDIEDDPLKSKELEQLIAEKLIPKLEECHIPRFDGYDFKIWFNKIKPWFEDILPHDTNAYLTGIKFYCDPPIAVIIDELNLPGSSWDKNEIVLSKYFAKRAASIGKYTEMAKGSSA